MFTDRFNTLLNEIGASCVTLSSYAGFGRTNISRIKSGKRIPSPGSSTATKISHAIYLFSKENRSYTKLCKTICISPGARQTHVESKILEWLFEDDNLTAFKNSMDSDSLLRKQKKDAFGERLNSSMELSDISNKRLSQLVHADPSLISRYRNGVRTPLSNPELSSQISDILFSRIISGNRLKELSILMNCPENEIDEDSYSSWLYDKDGRNSEDASAAAENLLDIFDSFTPGHLSNLYSAEDALKGITVSKEPTYIGIDGLRMAVLRFLNTAVLEHAKELYLYSDESQEWMTQDPSFLLRWASLMAAIVKNGTKIIIIHNLDRSLLEMNDAIKSWLPLYMSGMIESYYCRKQRNPRFSHTMFLIPGVACIRGFQVTSADTDAIYHYYTDAEIISVFQNEYEALLKSSSPLIHPLPKYSFPIVSDIIIIQNTLSLATMPEDLVKSLDDMDLYENWQASNTLLLKKLESNTVHECIPLADPVALRNGAVPIAPSFSDASYFYTPMQYSLHIRNIISLSEKYENYMFYPIPETPFSNIDLLISDNLTKITPASGQGLSFALNHPLMCVAFQAYARTMMEKNTIDRNSIKKMLEAFT